MPEEHENGEVRDSQTKVGLKREGEGERKKME